MKFIQEHPKIAIVIALVVVLFAALHLGGTKHPVRVSEAIESNYDELTQHALRAVADLDDQAKLVVLVYDMTYELGGEPHFKRVFRALEKEGCVIQHVERLVYDRERGWNEFRQGFPYAEFLEVARAHPHADAILSLCGAPYGGKGADQEDPSALPPLLLTRAGDSGDQLYGP